MKKMDLYCREELKQSLAGNIFLKLPDSLLRYERRLIKRVVNAEKGVIYSYSLRRHLEAKYKIILGSYSFGVIDDLFNFGANTSIGRYASIGPGVRVFNANHPMDFLSMHPFFYSPIFGLVDTEKIERHSISIGHDTWIGANAIICPGCYKIGNGAIVGAGSVVTNDVPDFTVVAGNPAKVIRQRFDDDLIGMINQLQWWDKSAEELRERAGIFSKTAEVEEIKSSFKQEFLKRA